MKHILYDRANVLHELFPYSKQVFAMVLQLYASMSDQLFRARNVPGFKGLVEMDETSLASFRAQFVSPN